MPSWTLQPRPPFRLDLTVWALRRLPINEMDRWDGRTWRRVLIVHDSPVEIAVEQTAGPARPKLEITVAGRLGVRDREEVDALVNRILGLDLDLSAFYALARSQPFEAVVLPLVGLRPPRMPTVFETLINGIACQQLSLAVGIHLLNRTVALAGPSADDHHAFPRPKDLAQVKPAALRAVGFSTRKAETILDIAGAAAAGRLDFADLADLPDVDAIARLRSLRGIGRWTAEYVLLRGLRRLDNFPADDVGGQNRLQELFELSDRPDYETCQELLAPLRPYRGLLYFHLLLNERVRQGLVAAGA